jgi:hypothetical protein
MRKLSLAVIGMYLGILGAFSQNTTDSSTYKSKKLKLEEVNFVSGYYHQTGNHSAVTGGVGSETLTDFANTIDLRFYKYDSKLRKHNLTFELGVDHYTSASSDKIDPYSVSSASYSDTRIYPSVNWNIQNEKKGTTVGFTGSFSNEFDYNSLGAGVNFTKTSKDHNQEFNAKLQGYFDTWKVIYPVELRGNDFGRGNKSEGSQPRNSYSASFSFAQIVNKRLQVLFLADPAYQSGLLATKYQRVYFKDGTERVENLPDSRRKLPLGVRANLFLGDRFVLRSFYRYYMDDWGLKAHTIDFELPVKITSFVSVSPFYRYYTQNAIDNFAPYAMHNTTETFYTSDYDLSKFNSHFWGTGLRLSPPNGVFKIKNWNSLELRYGHYNRSEGLNSNIVSLAVKLK